MTPRALAQVGKKKLWARDVFGRRMICSWHLMRPLCVVIALSVCGAACKARTECGVWTEFAQVVGHYEVAKLIELEKLDLKAPGIRIALSLNGDRWVFVGKGHGVSLGERPFRLVRLDSKKTVGTPVLGREWHVPRHHSGKLTRTSDGEVGEFSALVWNDGFTLTGKLKDKVLSIEPKILYSASASQTELVVFDRASIEVSPDDQYRGFELPWEAVDLIPDLYLTRLNDGGSCAAMDILSGELVLRNTGYSSLLKFPSKGSPRGIQPVFNSMPDSG